MLIIILSLVGEVNKPGQYKIYQDKINIFEMIAMAGDLSVYAKRDDVVLVRKTETGSQIHHIDLLDEELLESEFYYLMPDDIIYIKPVKGKNFAFSFISIYTCYFINFFGTRIICHI